MIGLYGHVWLFIHVLMAIACGKAIANISFRLFSFEVLHVNFQFDGRLCLVQGVQTNIKLFNLKGHCI